MKKIIILIMALVSSFCVFSQKTFKANDIDVISLDTTNNKVYFFKKISKDLYKPVAYEENEKTFGLDFKVEDDYYKQKEIVEDYEFTFFIDDIKPTNPKKYLKNKWLFKLKDEDEEHENKLISAINPYIFGVHNIYFGKSRGGDGMGTVTTKLLDDEVKKWRSNYADFLEVEIIKLKNGRYIYIFFDEHYNVDGFLIPTNPKDYFYFDNNDFTTLKRADKQYEITIDDNLERFDFFDFYKLQKKKNKYQLQTKSKIPIIHKTYDTIFYNAFYFIGKRKNKFDVFTKELQPLKIPNLKSVYIKLERWLEVLTKNEAKYINKQLQTITEFPSRFYTVCGTVPSLDANIKKNDTIKIPYLEYSIGYWSDRKTAKRVQLKNIFKTDSITFLDKDSRFYVDGDEAPITEEFLFDQLFRVKRNGKIGLFQLKDAIKFPEKPWIEKVLAEDFQNLPILEPKETFIYKTTANLTQLVPFEFDKLEYKSGVIYIEKGNKKGYLYNLTPMLFDEFKKETSSFFKIENNGKKGFIDVVTGKEYY